MYWLPRTARERLQLAGLVSLCCHLLAWLWLDALPPRLMYAGHGGVLVRLQAAPAPAAAVPPPSGPLTAATPPSEPLAATRPAGPPPQASAAVPDSGEVTKAAPSPADFGQAAAEAMLSLPRFYTAAELDTLAQPLSPVPLPDTDYLPDDIEITVYIDASGHVLRVDTPDELVPDYAMQVRARFFQARFAPALIGGVPVPSVKRIALTAEDL